MPGSSSRSRLRQSRLLPHKVPAWTVRVDERVTGRLLDYEYSITIDDVQVRQYISMSFRDSAAPVRDPESIAVRSNGDSFTLQIGDTVVVERASMLHVLTLLVWNLNRRSVPTDRADGVYLHAGAVALDGRAALIVGQSGAGKTTATIGLARSGFDYLTDDVVLLDAEGNVRGSRKPVGLRSPSPIILGLDDLPVPPGIDLPDALPVAASTLGANFIDTARVGAIVFLTTEGQPGSSRPLSRATALHRLVEHSFNRTIFASSGLGMCADMLGATHVVEWTRGAIDTLDTTVRVLLDTPRDLAR